MPDFVSPAAFAAQSPTPQPSTAVATGQPPVLDNSGANARLAAAKMFEDIGGAAKDYAQQMDVVSAQDALNKLRAAQTDLTYGKDGFINVKGGAVADPNRPGGPLADDYKARFQQASDGILEGLSPGARRLVTPHVGATQAAFMGDLARHSVSETEKWQEGVYKDGQIQVNTEAARNAADPGKVTELANRAGQQATTLARFKGLPTDGVAKAAQSGVFRVAIETLLGTGANRQALTYFDSVKDNLDGADLVALQGKLKTVQNDLQGEQAANEELAKVGLPGMPSEDSSPGGPRENNIGNLRPTGASTGFQGFPTFDAGVQGAVSNLRAYPKAFNGGKPMTLMQIGEHWAPRGDGNNDPAQWARNVAAGAGLDPNTPIDPNDPAVMAKVARGIHTAEWGGAQVRSPDAYVAGTNAAFGGPRLPATGQPVAFKGDVKSGMAQAEQSLMQRPDINIEAKMKGIALLTKTRTQATAFQEAATKSLDDQAKSTMSSIIANPSLFKPGTFDDFANRYSALGQQETATRYKMLASMEGSFKDGLQSATDAQLEMLKQLAPEGLPKQIVEGYISGNTKMRTEAGQQGAEMFGQLHKSVETDGVRPSGLVDVAKQTMDHFVHAGKPEKAQEVADFMNAALEAEHVNTGGSQEAANAISQMKEAASRGQSNAQRLQVLSVAQNLFASQQRLIDQDPYKAGTSIYPQVGAAPQFDWTNPESIWQTLDIRSNQARNIQTLTGRDTIPFTNEEVENVRLGLDKGDPQTNAMTLQSLGKFLPGDMIPGVSKALVGKGGGDGISQSYGAALGLFSSGNAADSAVAGDILKGAAIRKARGEDAKSATPAQDAWKQELQTKLGTSLSRVDPRQKTMIEQAIQSVYTYRMARSGQSAEKFDASVMDDSINSVLGESVSVNGGKVYPPERGQTSYDVTNALSTITDADVKGLKTLDGTDIPARLIHGAQLQNVGTGHYVVTVRDPKTGTRAEIPDPKKPGSAWVLDLSPYMARAKEGGGQAVSNPAFSGIALP